jgi:hypothetical protein
MKPWWVNVLMHEIAVLSWPPPWVPVEMNMPAYLPQKEPWAHCLPLLSQKAVPKV